jgi:Raf kinase inhibitor-like YbhB/YbcL family protein
MAFGIHRRRFGGAKRKLFLALAICSAATGAVVTRASVMKPPEAHKQMELTSSAFKNGQPIPNQYTCEGNNISPPLTWNGAPGNTETFALIVDDPDAPKGVWTHWMVFNLPADASGLPEAAAKSGPLPGNAKEGLNDFNHPNYDGPCPPAGKEHRYFFKIYALDTALGLPSGASRKDMEAAMAKHILAEGQLMGTYQRK